MNGTIGTSEINCSLPGSEVSSGKVSKKQRSRFSFRLFFIILFLIHSSANIVIAKKDPSFFLQNDGKLPQFLLKVKSICNTFH